MSEAGGVGGGGNGGAGGVGGAGGIGGNDGANGTDNDSGTTGDSLGGGPNSAEASVGLDANDSATASAPSAEANAAANAALGAAATPAPASVNNAPAATGLTGMISDALDSFSSVVDGFSNAMDKMGGFAPPGISAAIDIAKDVIGLGKSVIDGFSTGDWSGISNSLFDMASNFTDKLAAARDAFNAIREGDWESALDAAAKISKTAEKVNNIVDFVQSVQSGAQTGNWNGTVQAARAF